MRVEFKDIDKSVIHKDKLTDKHCVIISTSESGAKYLLIPYSSYTHGMNSSCTTINFIANHIDIKGLHDRGLWVTEEKNLKECIEYCKERNYSMFAFSTLNEAINEMF